MTPCRSCGGSGKLQAYGSRRLRPCSACKGAGWLPDAFADDRPSAHSIGSGVQVMPTDSEDRFRTRPDLSLDDPEALTSEMF